MIEDDVYFLKTVYPMIYHYLPAICVHIMDVVYFTVLIIANVDLSY